MRNLTLAAKFISAAVLLLSPGVGRAGLITNGGFETGDLTGWTATGAMDVSCTGGAHSGRCYLLSGTGTLTQDLVTTPGDTYTLDFWVSLQGDALTVKWNGSILFEGSPVPSSPYEEHTFVNLHVTSASTPLEFDFQQTGSASGALDDVSVTDNSATPEPGTVLLSIGGILILVGRTIAPRGRSCPQISRRSVF